MGNFNTSLAVSVQVDIQDAKSRHRFTNYQSKRMGGGLRCDVREFSRQSRSRLIYKARNIPDLKTFITLTYPDESYSARATGGEFMVDGRVIKEQLRRVRQWLTYRGLFGFWFLEFQARGAPHIHICTNGGLAERDIKKLHSLWYKLVGTDCPHHLEHGVKYEILREKQAPAVYAAKYSSKSEQKTVPDGYKNVGRFWGLFGPVPQDSITVNAASVSELFRVARIARNWAKADARAKGYTLRRITGRGITGHSFYNCAPVLRAYLSRVYTLAESPSQIVLRAPPSSSFAC